MKYTIIEDASPYYIRFTFDRLNDIIKYLGDTMLTQGAGAYANQGPAAQGYQHKNFNNAIAETIISMLPMSNDFTFNNKRVAVFDTRPHGGCGIHKDGYDCKISFNIPLEIADDLCVTNWYSQDLLEGLQVDSVYTRNVYEDFRTMQKFPAVKTMTARPNEMLLFNTDIFHSWDNTASANSRKILTLRILNPDNLMFEDVRQKMFAPPES
jgi:hypothetical protein